MASQPRRRQRIHPVIFLAYGLFALVITGALFTSRVIPCPYNPDCLQTLPNPSPGPTVTPLPGHTPEPTATPGPIPTPTPAPGLFTPDPRNPLNLPDAVQTAVLVFTTLSGVASLLRFVWDALRGIVSNMNRLRRRR